MWKPILEGEAADRARSTVLEIARAFAQDGGVRPKVTDAPIFWAYVAGAFDEPWIQARYDESVDELARHAAVGFHNCSLYYGAAATGFALAHISEPGAAEDVLDAIDRVIFDALGAGAWTDDYDLINGLVGIGVYLVERSNAVIAQQALDRVVAHLLATCERTSHGSTWHTRPELLPPRQRAVYSAGYYNCGLAHGVPGVVALLGRVANARTLAIHALQWLDAQASDGRYPSWFMPGDTRIPARTAWCYGDPGVAIATWSARVRLGLSIEPARELALQCTRRPLEASGVEDAGLCHGAAGLAHIFNRCFHASGDEAFRDAAIRWYLQTLAMKRPDGLGGYLAWTEGSRGVAEWMPSTSLLEGATGIALTLLAAIEPSEPNWDRVLLCDLPLSDSSDR